MAYSSYPKQKLIFENWRAFSEKELLEEEEDSRGWPIWLLDQFQNVLMIGGFFDFGPFIPFAMGADAINAIIFAIRGMWIDFVISVICIIPWVGWIGGTTKVGSLSGRASKIAFGAKVLEESGVLKSADDVWDEGNRLLRSLLKVEVDAAGVTTKAWKGGVEIAIKAWEDKARPILVTLFTAAGLVGLGGTAYQLGAGERSGGGDRGEEAKRRTGRYHVIASGETPRQTIERYFPQLETEQEKIEMLNAIIASNDGLMPGQYKVGQDIMIFQAQTVESP